jgi:hypothetical protein
MGSLGPSTSCRTRAGAAGITDSDAGMVGGIETLPFGLLVFVVGSLLVAQAWAVVDAKLAVDAAASRAATAARSSSRVAAGASPSVARRYAASDAYTSRSRCW